MLAQDYPALQVIVVDGGSTDRTAAVVVAFASADPRVELMRCSRIRIPAAPNTGLARSRGRWLVRVDAHSTIRPGYVRTTAGRLSMGRWAGLGGRKDKDGVGETAAGRAIAAAMSSRFGVGNSTSHYGTTVTRVGCVPAAGAATAGERAVEVLRRLTATAGARDLVPWGGVVPDRAERRG